MAAPEMLNKKKNLHVLRDAMLIGMLLVLLLIVMMPMLWMILTAFKTPGTAFQMDIIPRTTLYDPPMSESPVGSIGTVSAETCIIHASFVNPQATSVVALVREEGRTEPLTIIPLRRSFRGTWSGTLGEECGLYEGRKVTLHYLVNDETEVAAAEGFAVITAGEADLDNRIQVINGRLLTSTSDIRDGETAELILYDGEAEVRRLPMEKAGNRYSAETMIGGISELGVRFAIKRPFSVALAEKYTTGNFRAILGSETFNFGRYFFNSLVVATTAGLLTVIICTLAGYAFAQLNFHFRDPIFGLLLASMLVPGMIFMVPQFSITLRMGLMDSYAGMVVPHLANVFGLFLLRQYISQIPRDLFAAAEIDGARQYQIFQTIVIPICLPIMVTLFLLVFVGQWSNFLWQLIINTGASEVLTLPVGLQQFKGQNANEWEKIMAGACFSIIPIAVLFLSLQRYFLQGLTAGAVKE